MLSGWSESTRRHRCVVFSPSQWSRSWVSVSRPAAATAAAAPRSATRSRSATRATSARRPRPAAPALLPLRSPAAARSKHPFDGGRLAAASNDLGCARPVPVPCVVFVPGVSLRSRVVACRSSAPPCALRAAALCSRIAVAFVRGVDPAGSPALRLGARLRPNRRFCGRPFGTGRFLRLGKGPGPAGPIQEDRRARFATGLGRGRLRPLVNAFPVAHGRSRLGRGMWRST